ncbi:triphosphoribosyl-dephospho-CoA synthase [Methanobacterium formicicum]|uniref:Triphosphoribosyl-dephospho-CoA protein n=1 Tax=Methanobacterium formicicum (strain DSM 3637 / PP1) TaxID=1204725 RepID=K2QXJ3_METFP|nr:triphosphoribosyl-dephospho-CoA synthase [Methanobacterium formicicum]EKF85008.1 triphosphoribosyl-dephospho-CoA protein [Methanobacterium formicicum DSM 3637]
MESSYVAKCAQIASVLEVSGHPKPGNVHRTRNFPDMVFEDFLLSGIAIGKTMEKAAERGFKYRNRSEKWDKMGLGELILEAVTETDHWVANNTNLGIVMLLTPISVVAGMFEDVKSGETENIGISESGTENTGLIQRGTEGSIEIWNSFRERIEQIMRSTTSEDAVNLYRAINIADAGGMGQQDDLDVAADSSLQKLRDENVNMFNVLKMSSAWDKLSYELTHKMPVTFEIGYPTFKKIKSKYEINQATVHTFLTILSEVPDTLISRKFGDPQAEEVRTRAKSMLEEGGILTSRGVSLVEKFDHELIDNGLNPGTTADFTASSIMVAYLDDYSDYKAKLQ